MIEPGFLSSCTCTIVKRTNQSEWRGILGSAALLKTNTKLPKIVLKVLKTESTQLTASPIMEILFLTRRKSSITLVLKHHPSSIMYNRWGRICICNILWLIRCMNGFLKSFMTKKCFMRLSYAWACPSLPMERECFTMKYLSICYFWTMSVMKHYDKVDIRHLIVPAHQPTCGWSFCLLPI